MVKRWLGVVLCATAVAISAEAGQGRSSAEVPQYRGPLPPIPSSPHAAAPPDVVRAVYEFVARRPDVMRYVPCFCGCERNGHQNNAHCFVAKRDPDGRPHWDAHGLSCKVCIDVARDAMRMTAAGRPLTEIRTTIERTYSPHFPTMTPTPAAPPSKKR